jgi:hypothetical protein
MPSDATFDELLDAVEHLSPEDQADLVAVIQRRLAERGRQRIVAEVHEARTEFEKGQTKQTNANDLIREIGS